MTTEASIQRDGRAATDLGAPSPLQYLTTNQTQAAEGKLIIVSNRLPIEVKRENGLWVVKKTIGGLVTGVDPMMKRTAGDWYGYAGQLDEEAIQMVLTNSNNRYHPIAIESQLYDTYYGQVANRVLWADLHGAKQFVHIQDTYEEDYAVYQEVNDLIAAEVAENVSPKDMILVNDYHLFEFARKFKRRYGSNCPRIAIFQHVPMSDVDTLSILPNAEEIIRAMLEFDFIGFHTYDYQNNFDKAVKYFIREATTERNNGNLLVDLNGRTIKVATHPISIDPSEITNNLESSRVRGLQLRKALGAEGKILFTDAGRGDHTKGTHQTLEAVDTFLTLHPDMKDQVVVALVLAPSREDLPEYQEYNKKTKALILSIRKKHNLHGDDDDLSGILDESGNGKESVIKYIRGLPRQDLIALLTTTDIALIAPPTDGMNLVAKEYMVAGPDDGILILSKNVGAAQELADSALLVNPLDTVAYAQTIYEAILMKRNANRECIQRKRHGKATVLWYNAGRWANGLVRDAFGTTA